MWAFSHATGRELLILTLGGAVFWLKSTTVKVEMAESSCTAVLL